MPPPTLKEDTIELERLTHTLLRVLNSHDFTYTNADGKELLAHVSPNFEARFDTQPHALTWSQQTEIWRDHTTEYPALQFAVQELTVQVRRRSGTASVFLKLALTGMPGDVQFQGSCELMWRYDSEVGTWMLERHVTMRGLLLDGSIP